MSTHTIHEEKIDFHTGTEHAVDWLRRILSREGFKEFLNEATEHKRFDFHDDIHREKFMLEYDEESEKFSVYRRD